MGLLSQCLNLEQLGIPAISLTSLTPKDDVGEIYKRIESDPNLRLVYGTAASFSDMKLNPAHLPLFKCFEP